jgi:hypothetical protein
MHTIDLDELLKYPSASSHSVAHEVSQSNSLGCELPAYLRELLKEDCKLSKMDVIQIIKDASSSPRDEFLAILFWGAYFRVTARSPRIQRALLDFILDQNFDTALAQVKTAILESDDSESLFRSFSYCGKFKIPGLSYAYFTKLFFFYREAEGLSTYPILDKWLCMAWCAVDGTLNENTRVYDTYFRSPKSKSIFLLRRKPAQAYGEYVAFMSETSNHYGLSVADFEEKLFGRDLRVEPNSFNPRNEYKAWANHLKKYPDNKQMALDDEDFASIRDFIKTLPNPKNEQ